jgi:hypothetical protein
MVNLLDVPEYFEKYKNLYFEVSELCEGLSVCYGKNKKDQIVFDIIDKKEATPENSAICLSIIEKSNMEKALQNFPKKLTIEGFIIGKGIKNNFYKHLSIRFLMYNIKITRINKYFTADKRIDLFNEFLLNCGKICHVPVICDEIQLFSEFTSMKSILDFTKSPSSLNNNILQKGIVCRSLKKVNNKIIEFKILNKE